MRLRLAITIIALLLAVPFALQPRAETADRAKFLQSYEWHGSHKFFGGFSAVELDSKGTGFIALSDRTLAVKGTIERHKGQITGIKVSKKQSLLGTDGKKLWKLKRDSEGLAIGQDGRLFVSFEMLPRVWSYDSPWGRPEPLPEHASFAKMEQNRALEALAIDASGRLYTLPEKPLRGSKTLPLYVFDGTWRVVRQLTHLNGFAPVGADFGPDGHFYLLERNFGGLGFRSRVRRFDLGASDPTGEILFTSDLGDHDNLEGLSVWRDQDGHIRLTMLSDDNFKFFQKTEFVEYVVTEKLAKPPTTH